MVNVDEDSRFINDSWVALRYGTIEGNYVNMSDVEQAQQCQEEYQDDGLYGILPQTIPLADGSSAELKLDVSAGGKLYCFMLHDGFTVTNVLYAGYYVSSLSEYSDNEGDVVDNTILPTTPEPPDYLDDIELDR